MFSIANRAHPAQHRDADVCSHKPQQAGSVSCTRTSMGHDTFVMGASCLFCVPVFLDPGFERWHFCFNLPGARIRGVCHHGWLWLAYFFLAVTHCQRTSQEQCDPGACPSHTHWDTKSTIQGEHPKAKHSHIWKLIQDCTSRKLSCTRPLYMPKSKGRVTGKILQNCLVCKVDVKPKGT